MSKFPTNIVASLHGWWKDDMVYEHEGPTERYIRADIVAEQTAEIERLRTTIAASDERLQNAAERVGIMFGCDSADWMADRIDELWQTFETTANQLLDLKRDTDARIAFLEKALDEMFLMFEEARKDSQRLAVVYSYNGDMASHHQDAKCKRLADFAAAYLRERDAKS